MNRNKKFSPIGGVREGLLLLTMLVGAPIVANSANYYAMPEPAKKQEVAVQSTIKDLRPAPEKRLFRSEAVEKQILDLKSKLTAIDPMWLRDSAAQVWPYLRYVKQDEPLRHLIRGVIRRQLACILIDPYANAFNIGPTGGEWQSDNTKMKKELHERKYEIDSLCYPLRLAYAYWQQTGDTSIFDEKWLQAIREILHVFQDQQNWNGPITNYRFTRKTEALHDTRSNRGYGHPGKPCGLIASAFRPSDDSTIFPYLVPQGCYHPERCE